MTYDISAVQSFYTSEDVLMKIMLSKSFLFCSDLKTL